MAAPAANANMNMFDQLEAFLPKHVSILPSGLHALAAFVATGLAAYYLGGAYISFDFTRDDQLSETDERAQHFVRVAVAVLLSIIAADAVFSFSFRVRGFRINKKHHVYQRWFPRLYS